MVFLVFVLVAALSLSYAKTCKPVNYKFKQYKAQQYGYGCKKGCFGFANDTTGVVGFDGTKWEGGHRVQDKCVECQKINVKFLEEIGYSDPTAEEAADICFGMITCQWLKGKCVAASCPSMSGKFNCGGEWKDGKCKKPKDEDCEPDENIYLPCSYSCSMSGCSCDGYYDYDSDCKGKYYRRVSSDVTVTCSNMTSYYKRTHNDCDEFALFSSDDQKECKYKCEHPGTEFPGPYEYTKDFRKVCHKVMGCMYSGGHSAFQCSYLAVWAFVLILVIAILVALALIGLACFLIFKLCGGNKSTKVDPAADKSASAPAAKAPPQATPAAQAPPPEVGPFVVIKVGKQESKTKKVESAVWGQSIVFSGMGPEDDDVIFELHDDSDALLGSADVRIPDYVNAKKRAAINLKNGETVIGVLEVDIEIQVQEEPEVKITGVLFVDKFIKI